jgi:Helix-turn-helix.
VIPHKDRWGAWQARFDARVLRTDKCWIWLGVLTSFGYGSMRVRGHRQSVHRLSYERYIGPIPPEMCVLHKCDVAECVNPDHLFLGTRTDNSTDKMRKGRQPHGEALPQARLTEAHVNTIRQRYAQGVSQATLAKDFSIHQSAISRIVNGQRWTHIHEPAGY